MAKPAHLVLTRTQTSAAEDYFSERPQTQRQRAASYASGMMALHRSQSEASVMPMRSPGYRPPPTPAWDGSRTPHGMQIAPAAVDYFHAQTAERTSWRALQNLAMVAGGRCIVSLGLAGVSEAYVRGGLLALPNRPEPLSGVMQHFHQEVFILGAVGAVIGLLLHTIGVGRFHHDTSKINRRRAHIVGAAATLGAFMVAGGGAWYAYALVQNAKTQAWETLPVRAVGNGCVFFSIPASFSSSELTHGVIPIKNRILWRDACFAGGGALLMAWAQMSAPHPPAPLWAREVTQCLGIVLTALGGALPRVDAMRAQATARRESRPAPAGLDEALYGGIELETLRNA